MDIFFDLYQCYRINEAERKAERAHESARETVRELRMDIDELQRRNAALAIACQALWELLREQGNFSDESLLAKIKEIDLRDGKLDGKTSGEQVSIQCPNCQRETSARRRVCLYCGTVLPSDKAFQQY